jgi:hypothetical protein
MWHALSTMIVACNYLTTKGAHGTCAASSCHTQVPSFVDLKCWGVQTMPDAWRFCSKSRCISSCLLFVSRIAWALSPLMRASVRSDHTFTDSIDDTP